VPRTRSAKSSDLRSMGQDYERALSKVDGEESSGLFVVLHVLTHLPIAKPTVAMLHA
jgi:hypothetical protein